MTTTDVLHEIAAGLGALYALSVVVNMFNPLIALRWPQLAAVLSTMGGHIADARREVGTIKLARKMKAAVIGAATFLLVACSGCTAADRSTATQVVAVSEVACEVVVSVVAPADVGLCVTADELGNAIIGALGSVQGQALAKTGDGKVVVPEPVFARLNASPKIRARRVKLAPCKPGTVTP